MVKYLTQKNRTYWYRRKVSGFGEIVFSLKTKNYEEALIRHSYFDHKIKAMIYKGLFKKMTVEDIKDIINKYKNYMLEAGDYNDFEEQRDEDLTVTLDGQTFGGHTKEALAYAIKRYEKIHRSNDLEKVKEETLKILERTNLKDDFSNLTDPKDLKVFHWELLKAEWELIYKTYEDQKKTTDNLKVAKEDEASLTESEFKQISEQIKDDPIATYVLNKNNPNKNGISIIEITQKYIIEKKDAKGWSDKNEKDIIYVLGNLSNYHNDKNIDQLNREDFSSFRDQVLRFLPKIATKKIFRDKSTKEIIQIVKDNKLETIGISSVNKHLRRVHQVFEWASNCGYLEKNLTKDLKIVEKKKSKKQKTARVPYNQNELKKLFEQSPWFNKDILKTLRYNPEYVFIPLLALFTGAKPSELAQLEPKAIKKVNGVLGIDFNMMIKGSTTERFTPLSDTLIDLGFMKYVREQKRNKEKQLFPKVVVYRDNGTNFTNAFTKYNREHITQDEDKTFYSLRHLVNQMLKNKKTPVYIINDIIGHTDGNGNKDNEVYGDGLMPEEILRNTINECLVYDFLDFSKIKEAIKDLY